MCRECGCGNTGPSGRESGIDIKIDGVSSPAAAGDGRDAPALTHGHPPEDGQGHGDHDHDHSHQQHHHHHHHDHHHDGTGLAAGTGAEHPAAGSGPEGGGHHGQGQGHGHGHEPLPPSSARTLEMNRSILDENDRLAERNRGFFRGKGILLLNVLSSPGSGKTTLLQKTAEALRGRLRMGVIVGDLATQNDAIRLRASGIPVVQINTGTVCHLDAGMIARAASKLDLGQLDLVVIENVGNLVCPAMFDLGEELRVVLLSTTEGEDKPLKYPPMFHSAQVVLVTKTDLAVATGYSRDEAMKNLRYVSHHASVLELSARTGEGMEAWVDLLIAARKGILTS